MNRYVLLAVLVVANVATALLIVRDRHEHRLAFVAINKLDKARDELNIEFDRLQLEIATLGDAGRIQEQAANRLQMRAPVAADVVVVVP